MFWVRKIYIYVYRLGYSLDSESQLESQKSDNQKETNLSADSKQEFAVVLIHFYKLIALKKLE